MLHNNSSEDPVLCDTRIGEELRRTEHGEETSVSDLINALTLDQHLIARNLDFVSVRLN